MQKKLYQPESVTVVTLCIQILCSLVVITTFRVIALRILKSSKLTLLYQFNLFDKDCIKLNRTEHETVYS